jgi:hypothetical protein
MGKYFEAEIAYGTLIMADKNRFLRTIRNMPEGDYIVSIFKKTKGTSREMQKLYFAILGEWMNDTGWTKDELHELVKTELFPTLFDQTSTSDLTSKEWTILIREVEDFLIVKFENR